MSNGLLGWLSGIIQETGAILLILMSHCVNLFLFPCKMLMLQVKKKLHTFCLVFYRNFLFRLIIADAAINIT